MAWLRIYPDGRREPITEDHPDFDRLYNSGGITFDYETPARLAQERTLQSPNDPRNRLPNYVDDPDVQRLSRPPAPPTGPPLVVPEGRNLPGWQNVTPRGAAPGGVGSDALSGLMSGTAGDPNALARQLYPNAIGPQTVAPGIMPDRGDVTPTPPVPPGTGADPGDPNAIPGQLYPNAIGPQTVAPGGGGLPPDQQATFNAPSGPGILRVQLPDGSVRTLDGRTQAENINQLLLGGGQVLDYQGRPMRMFQMYGGWVGEDIDAGVPLPLNIIAGQGWNPGQQEALSQYFQAGWRPGMGTLEREPTLRKLGDSGSGAGSIDDQTLGTLLERYPNTFSWDPSQIANDPGYQFLLAEGERGVRRRAGADLSLLSGRTLKDLERFRTGLASTYANTYYDRASRDFERDYNIFEGTQNKRFNRLASIAGLGQTAVDQLNTAGTNYGANAGNLITNTGARNADLLTQAGNARASQFVAQGNAWANANPSNRLTDLYWLQRYGRP